MFRRFGRSILRDGKTLLTSPNFGESAYVGAKLFAATGACIGLATGLNDLYHDNEGRLTSSRKVLYSEALFAYPLYWSGIGACVGGIIGVTSPVSIAAIGVGSMMLAEGMLREKQK